MNFPAIEEILRETMGMSVATVGAGGIDRAVRRRMDACGCATEADYVRTVKSGGQELQNLIEDVVIPETWFFRDPEAFAALEEWVVREWLPERAGASLRVLSIPCSTGEEPYSIVMTLLGAGLEVPAFRIDAVDISAANLSAAARGVYGANSFRKSRPGLQQRFFSDTGTGYRVDDGVRAPVVFRRGNLLDCTPAPAAVPPYHVIFCRNLLIYFDRETQGTAMERLDGALAPGGLLFLGSAEMFLARELRYTPLDHAMSFAYRKPVTDGLPGPKLPAPAAAAIPKAPAPALPPAVIRPQPARRSPIPPPPAVPSPAAAAQAGPRPGLDHARALADAGDLDGAASACHAWLAAHGPSADCYFLLGLIADGQGDPDRAAEFYRKARYLDPRHAETLAHLAATAGSHHQADSGGKPVPGASIARRNPVAPKIPARPGGAR